MSYRIYDPNIVASRIKQLRKEKGITQSELAEGSGLGLSTIKQYESKTRVPDKHNLSLLANYFFVDENWIIGIDCGERNTSRFVNYSGDGYSDGKMVYDMAECPNCGKEFEDGDDNWGCANYCPNCGQRILWGDGEEMI